MKALALAALMVLSTIAPIARADEVDRCVEASERGQNARRRRALVAARDAFIECAADTCPAIVRSTCSDWVRQVDATLPTVVVAVLTAKDKEDLPSARVTIDGRPVLLDGAAVAIDPGAHTIDAQSEGYAATKLEFIAREGERARILRVMLPKTAAPAADAGKRAAVQPITWITGGLALAALGSFAFFGAKGASDADELRSTCAPFCSTGQRDAVATKYLVADVSLVAAVVLGGVSVWTLVSRPGMDRAP